MPDLRQLRAFVAVAEELNFTRAAERLHLGQQAVSKSVAELERQLGVTLLERTTREVSLTPAGASLLASGREVLVAAEDAFARAQTVGRGLAGTVRIGVTPAIDPATRQEAARVLRDGAPELSVAFHEVRPADIEPVLRDRTLDVILVRTFAGAPEVDSAALQPTPAELAVPATHRLAGSGPVRLQALDGERLLVHSKPGTPYTDLLLDHLSAAGALVVPVESRITGSGGLEELSNHDAVALVPQGTSSDGNVVVVIEDDLAFPLLLLWPAGLPTAAVRRLREGMGSVSSAARR